MYPIRAALGLQSILRLITGVYVCVLPQAVLFHLSLFDLPALAPLSAVAHGLLIGLAAMLTLSALTHRRASVVRTAIAATIPVDILVLLALIELATAGAGWTAFGRVCAALVLSSATLQVAALHRLPAADDHLDELVPSYA